MGGQEVQLPLFDDGITTTKDIIEYTDDWDAKRPYGTHRALDIVAAQGTPVYPVKDGTVLFVRSDPENLARGGNAVIIDHGNGNLSLYCHLDSISVSEGASVIRGETIASSTQIGTVGHSGRNIEGNHLHLQFRRMLNKEQPWMVLFTVSLASVTRSFRKSSPMRFSPCCFGKSS